MDAGLKVCRYVGVCVYYVCRYVCRCSHVCMRVCACNAMSVCNGMKIVCFGVSKISTNHSHRLWRLGCKLSSNRCLERTRPRWRCNSPHLRRAQGFASCRDETHRQHFHWDLGKSLKQYRNWQRYLYTYITYISMCVCVLINKLNNKVNAQICIYIEKTKIYT